MRMSSTPRPLAISRVRVAKPSVLRLISWLTRVLTAHQHGEVLARREKGDETLMEIARSNAVSYSTISRL